ARQRCRDSWDGAGAVARLRLQRRCSSNWRAAATGRRAGRSHRARRLSTCRPLVPLYSTPTSYPRLVSSLSTTPTAGGDVALRFSDISNKLGARNPVPALARYFNERSAPKDCTYAALRRELVCDPKSSLSS